MRNRTFGILAHVDAGKTTLSEQILFRTGALRAAGRVDHGDTALDTDPIERARGITVFSDQAQFALDGQSCTLIDTPGHVDFAAETERALAAIDAAILLLDAGEGVTAHAVMLARLAAARGIPLIVFLNKCDLPGADPDRACADAAARLGRAVLSWPVDPERLAEMDERYLELYLGGTATPADYEAGLQRAFLSGELVPALRGSALSGDGVDELLEAMDTLTRPLAAVDGDDGPFRAVVYKVRRDAKDRRVAYMRVLSGTLGVRDVVQSGEVSEKVQEIRVYSGDRYSGVDTIRRGDAAGVVGLRQMRAGDTVAMADGVRTRAEGGEWQVRSALAVGVASADGTPQNTLYEKLKVLEDEDPQLEAAFEPLTGELLVRVMGPVQTEVLAELLRRRFGIEVVFTKPRVLYRETLASPVMGYGHYEPLRHYAEVDLRLEPGPRGSGIAFASECHIDTLALQYQNLIRTHVFERVHRGVLTGAPLTDVRVVLTAGRAHLKHTEGGDFREAVYRAIRQGLMRGESLLLEPYYRFEIIAPAAYLGRIMADITVRAGEAEAPRTLGDTVLIRGRAPVSTFADYGIKLRSATNGRGEAALFADGYDLCHDAEAVISASGYRPLADTEQPASSVFCSHGAGFTVPWDEAEALMHCPKR